MNESGYPTSVGEMKNRFKKIFEHPDYRTIVAVVNEEITGMAGLARGISYEKNRMYIRIIVFVVKQNHRKQGIGKLLINAVEEWAIKEGSDTVILNSGNREERQAALMFHQKMGYAVKSSGFVEQL